MKQIIIILFLLPLFCKAQTDKATTDTIKIIMLVSDTSLGIIHEPDTIYWTPSETVSYKLGYEVRSVTYRIVDLSVNPNYTMQNGTTTLMAYIPKYETKAFYSHLKYLGADKKELSKNIIVWQTK